MRVLLKDHLVVLIPESVKETQQLESWRAAHLGHVFCAHSHNEQAMELHGLGERREACREPINVVSNSPDRAARLISNFAEAPFELGSGITPSSRSGKASSSAGTASAGAWHSLRRLAREEGDKQGYAPTVSYPGQEIPVGTWAHWQLMERACRAKFSQSPEAAAALLGTGDRPPMHVMRRDSRTIPGVVMAAIWMRIRKELRQNRPNIPA
jgi:hypothetical protein